MEKSLYLLPTHIDIKNMGKEDKFPTGLFIVLGISIIGIIVICSYYAFYLLYWLFTEHWKTIVILLGIAVVSVILSWFTENPNK